MKPAYVIGTGWWAPGHAGPEHPLLDEADAADGEPAATLLPPRLARRTSLLTRMVAAVAAQAGIAADLSRVPMILATAYGESDTLKALLEMLHVDGELSPTRFHNSVANTALGYLSIAQANRSFSTVVQAGPDTVAMGLVEALALLATRQGEALLLLADEAPPPPFDRPGLSSLAVGLHLAAEPGAGDARPVTLANLRREPGAPPPEVPAGLATNPVGAAAGLLRAIEGVRAATRETTDRSDRTWRALGSVPVSLGAGGWVVDVGAGGEA